MLGLQPVLIRQWKVPKNSNWVTSGPGDEDEHVVLIMPAASVVLRIHTLSTRARAE